MRNYRAAAILIGAMALFAPPARFAHAAASGQKTEKQPAPTTRLTIEVTGGDQKQPIAEASVYLKYVMVVKHGRDQKFELNLKTNHEGVAHSPEIPQGKVLIQIVAPNWKTFGEYYDLQEQDQTIQIHLDRPTTKWY